MNHSLGTDPPEAFARDRLTFLTYGMAIVFGFAVAAMGPAMPLLREDLGISRTVGGLHFTALAAGAVLAGVVVERFVQAWGRRVVFWVGGAGVAAGSLLIGVGWHPAVTLPGAVVAGCCGSAALVASQATLSDRHPNHRPVVLTEINTAMSVGTVTPALLVGALVAVNAGWRAAFVAPLAALALLVALLRAETFPPVVALESSGPRRRLPAAYWLFWAAFIPSVGAEWCLGAWGADYLVDIAGTSEASASFLMTAFFGAMVIGRLVGGKVAQFITPLPLLLGTTLIGLSGVILFWASQTVFLVVGGLLISGLGISMQFPMLLSLALGTAPGHVDVAAARISIGAGGSVMVAPLVLGAIADQVGIRAAFGMVPGLAICVVVLAALGERASRRGDLTPSPLAADTAPDSDPGDA